MLNKVESCVKNELERNFDSILRKEVNYYHGERGDWHTKALEVTKDIKKEAFECHTVIGEPLFARSQFMNRILLRAGLVAS